jgi:GMP synthase (glutamine-hydrolysing)
MREVYLSGTPSFGSCWGLQMGAMAAGGDVQMNQKGREVGFARRITQTDEGTRHPMLQGRPMSFDAPAIHLDVVTTLPEHVTVLASNTVTPVQAAEIHHEGGVFWGVQYHPEFSLTELATILKRYHDTLLAEGMFLSSDDHAAYIDDLLTLESDRKRTDLSWRFGLDEEVLDDFKRLTEIRNFIEHYVKPKKSERGRA